MTYKTDPNDFAFSMPITYRPDGEWMGGPNAGLTKRELFAMAAMQGLLSNLAAIRREGFCDREIEEFAVMRADALIAALNAALNGEVND